MKFFIGIKKKWLQHRVYKYTLKYQDALSKSDSLFKMSENYNSIAEYYKNRYGVYRSEFLKNYEMATDYILKSSHQKNLSDIYLSKKLDLEEELQSLTYRKA